MSWPQARATGSMHLASGSSGAGKSWSMSATEQCENSSATCRGRSQDGFSLLLGFERRWVIYAGESDGSMTPQGWYGWLHHTFDVPPTQEEYAPRTWELPQPNLTRTPQAWRPPGSTLAANARPAITRPGRRKARWSLVHGWTRPPRRGKHHLDRQPGAGHYSCVDKAELSKSLA